MSVESAGCSPFAVSHLYVVIVASFDEPPDSSFFGVSRQEALHPPVPRNVSRCVVTRGGETRSASTPRYRLITGRWVAPPGFVLRWVLL